MRHNQLTCIAPLADNQRTVLTNYLEEKIGYQRKGNQANELLKQVPELHFLSMFTFVSPAEVRNSEGYLVIEASFDGSVDAFLEKFTTQFEPLNSILDHCKCRPSESAADFIRRHRYTPGCFYVSCPGLSRPQIDNESELLERLQTETSALMHKGPDSCRDSATMVAHMREVARQEGFLASRPPPEPFLVKYGPALVKALPVALAAIVLLAIPMPVFVLLGLAALCLIYYFAPAKSKKLFTIFGALAAIVLLAIHWRLPILLGLAAVYGVYRFTPAKSKILFTGFAALALLGGGAVSAAFSLNVPDWAVCGARIISVLLLIIASVVALALYRIEFFEQRDHIDPGWIDVEFMREVCQDENSPGCAQNHFINLSVVKPGALRRWTLRLVLWAVHYLGILYFNNGKLGGIPSIHFARWVMLDEKEFGKPLLLFLTNYDGSWDSYLGDFVDGASPGASGIWSNTGGFPLTWGLIIAGGSRYEKQFKAYARKGQQRTSAWFSAYPNLSVPQKLSNAELRRALDKDNLDPSAQDALLRRL
jgi:hypothetical protein